MHTTLLTITFIIALGLFAQWMAWRLRLPSILLLLIFGFLAGPVFKIITPQNIPNEVFYPLVSLAVAIILFEGSLSLSINELRQSGHTIIRLLTVGLILRWALITGGAYFILGLDFPLALLLGAVLIVTGPTVIMPMLRHIRPAARISAILKWEGIAIDPIGALLAILVFEVILSDGFHHTLAWFVVAGLLKTLFIGAALGALAAGAVVQFFKRYLIPDYLQSSFALSLVLVSFSLGSFVNGEAAGFFAVTLMGIILANQKSVAIKHISEFKENLGVVLLPLLFIILSARLPVSDLNYLNGKTFLFLLVLILVVRPLSVWVSTRKSDLTWQEKTFLSAMAPRGIVAAAVSSIFSFRLVEAGHANAECLVVITFFVIIGTVFIYSLLAFPVAYRLKIATLRPQGALIIGAHKLARMIAQVLQTNGFKVVLVDKNRSNAIASRKEGLTVYHGDILSQDIFDELDLAGIGRVFALTSNNEANSLALLHCQSILDRSELYQLPIKGEEQVPASSHLKGRFLFDSKAQYDYLFSMIDKGATIKAIRPSKDIDLKELIEAYKGDLIAFFVVTEKNELVVMTQQGSLAVKAGQTLLVLTQATLENF